MSVASTNLHGNVIRRSFDQMLSGFSSSSYRDLISNLVKRNLTVRYKRSAIGFLWTMLNPIIMTVVYTIVFSTIFRFGTEDFIIYFLSGFLVWNFFAQSTGDSCQCILASGTLIKKVYVPKTTFVLSSVVSNLINLGFAMIPLLALLLILGKGVNLSCLYVVPALILVTWFTLGVSFIVSALSVFFHDFGEMYRVLLTPWMFLTPIMYPMEIIPQKYAGLLHLNPMYHLVRCFRDPVYHGTAPEGATLLISIFIAGATLIIGYLIFKRLEDLFIYHV